MELELLWLLAPDLPTSSWLWGTYTACLGMSACTPSWLGGLTYDVLTATTLIYANGAGITLAAGTRFTLNYIGHSSITLGHKMSLCTAYTPSWLGAITLHAWDDGQHCLPGNECLHCLHSFLARGNTTACLG